LDYRFLRSITVIYLEPRAHSKNKKPSAHSRARRWFVALLGVSTSIVIPNFLIVLIIREQKINLLYLLCVRIDCAKCFDFVIGEFEFYF